MDFSAMLTCSTMDWLDEYVRKHEDKIFWLPNVYKMKGYGKITKWREYGVMSIDNTQFLLKQFDLGKVPIVSLENVTVVLSKEVGQYDYDLLHVRIEEMDIKKWVRKGKPVSEVYEENRKRKGNNNQTAGEVPFVMFFAKKVYKRFQSGKCVGNIVAQKAALSDLACHVEMRTGRLIKGWENNSHKGTASMTIADIAKVIGKKERQARTILHDLITNGFINKHKDGYYLNRDFFLRGKSWESDMDG